MESRGIGGNSAVQLLNQMAIRYRRYGAIGRRNFLQSLATLLGQLASGAAGARSGGLALGLGIGQVVGAISLLRDVRGPTTDTRSGPAGTRLWQTVVRYRRFPLLLAPSGLLNVLGLQLPVLLIAYFYGSEAAGSFGFTQRLLGMPVALIGLAVAQVYLAELSRSVRAVGGDPASFFLRASRQLAVIAAGGALLIIVGAPTAFSVVFGDEWTTSGTYARALALFMAAQFIGSPLSQTLVVLGRQGIQLLWDAGRLVLGAASIIITAASGGSALAGVWAFGLSAAIAYAVCWLLSLHSVAKFSHQKCEQPDEPVRPATPEPVGGPKDSPRRPA